VVALGLVPIAYLFALGRRLSIRIDEQGIRYRGWLTVKDANWKDVTGVIRTEDLPYPRNKYYGPRSYEVRTATRRFVINLLYFPAEFSRTFHDEVKQRRLLRRRRRSD
jgi:hypothetical protein